MKTLNIAAVLCLLLLFAVFTRSPSPVSATTQKPAFEYKVETGVSEGKINSLAAQGWEVVASGQYNGGMPYVIFKRMK